MRVIIALCAFLIFAASPAKAQGPEPAYGCTVKKDCFATYTTRQNVNIPVKAGQQYPVFGASGRMLVIIVNNKHYYIANGCVSLFKTLPHANSAASDTTYIPYDSLPVIKDEH